MSLEVAVTLILVAFTGAVLVTRIIAVSARKRGLLDHPNWRSSHSMPTPRLGGVGIIAGVLAARALGGWPASWESDAVLIAATALAAMGLLDDLRSLTPVVRLAIEASVAFALCLVVPHDIELDLPGATLTFTGVPAAVLAVIWIVGVVNIVNFMDGLDGLVGGTAAVAGLGLIAIGAPAPLALVLTASTVGFLVWNHSPASIFMGDTGSMFLGLLLAGSAFGSPAPVSLVPLALVLAPLLLDAAWTLIVRLRGRKPVFSAHHEHLYQRVFTTGIETRVIAAGYWVATGACVVLATRYPSLAEVGQLVLVAIVITVFLAYVAWVRRRESDSAGPVVAGGSSR
jgi:Fuc2NAc and GlcNAc transferase